MPHFAHTQSNVQQLYGQPGKIYFCFLQLFDLKTKNCSVYRNNKLPADINCQY